MGADRPDPVQVSACERLSEMMPRFRRGWIALILAVLCFAGTPAAADDPIQHAIAWLHTQQRPDGGFGQPTASASLTADVVYVLALLGEDPAGPAWTPTRGRSALEALATLAPAYVQEDAGQAGKVARAVALAGGNPRDFGGLDLLAIIRRAYDPATGRYHPTLLYRHTLAMEGLWRSGETVPAAAIQALAHNQLADGGWFWSFEAGQSDVDSTGRVMQILADLGYTDDVTRYARAAHFLCRRQLPGGGWDVGSRTGPANANSTALAVAGLTAVGYDPQRAAFRKADRGAVDVLRSFQEASGAFAYTRVPGKEENRLMATVDALVALATLARAPAQATPATPSYWAPNRWPERLSDWNCFRLR